MERNEETAVHNELLAAAFEYFGPMDDPSIGWVGNASHPDLFKCERCDQEHRDPALIVHRPYCRAVRLRNALAALATSANLKEQQQ
jgi:hypothetical protein